MYQMNPMNWMILFLMYNFMVNLFMSSMFWNKMKPLNKINLLIKFNHKKW